jgi:hypothetical protein
MTPGPRFRERVFSTTVLSLPPIILTAPAAEPAISLRSTRLALACSM